MNKILGRLATKRPAPDLPGRSADCFDFSTAFIVDAPAVKTAGRGEGPFIFVSHMDENEKFVDVDSFGSGGSKLLAGYLALEELPYNRIWKKRLRDRSSQPYAVQIYLAGPFAAKP